MATTTEESSYTWDDLASLIKDTPGALEKVLIHFEESGMIPKKLTDLEQLKKASNITNSTDTHTSGDMNKAEAIADLKWRLKSMVDKLRGARKQRPAVDTLWWFPIITRNDQHVKHTHGGREKMKVGSLASHLGLRDEELQNRLNIAGVSRYKSWGSALGVAVQSYLESDVKWLALDEPVEREWQHLPRDQIEGKVTRPVWTGRPIKGRIDGVTAEEKRTSEMSRATLSLIDNLVKGMAVGEVMERLEAEAKRSRAGAKNSLVPYKIADRVFELPCNYQPIRNQAKSGMESELETLRNRCRCLEAANIQYQKKAEEDAELVKLGSKLDSIKQMKQRPGNPQADSLYACLQAFCPKASAHSLSQVVSLSSAFFSILNIGHLQAPVAIAQHFQFIIHATFRSISYWLVVAGQLKDTIRNLVRYQGILGAGP